MTPKLRRMVLTRCDCGDARSVHNALGCQICPCLSYQPPTPYEQEAYKALQGFMAATPAAHALADILPILRAGIETELRERQT